MKEEAIFIFFKKLKQKIGDSFKIKLRFINKELIITEDKIVGFDGKPANYPEIVISINYLLSNTDNIEDEKFKAFGELKDGLMYNSAFRKNSIVPLIPYADYIIKNPSIITNNFNDSRKVEITGTDLAVKIKLLPKISIYTLLYASDEEFPANLNIIFSANAGTFLPIECIADLSEIFTRVLLKKLTMSAAKND
ncbi:MAG: DUF3786 domain-containing protein [Elusimicrobiota bacterium]|nr:DUF3786 domain-containing protein [Elusimicrobiota bacterium]